MRSFRDLAGKSEFLRNVMTLMPGTLLSQAIPIAFSVILARIYTPEFFGTYFVFTAILGLAVIFSTGKYELAILLPDKQEEAARLIGVALTTTIAFCSALLVVFIILNQYVANSLGDPHLRTWLLLLPFSLFFSSANEVFYYWHNRQQRYRTLSWSKIIQTLSSSTLQLVLGYLIMGESGLIIGLVAGQAISFFYLFFQYLTRDKGSVKFHLFHDYKVLARRYLQFPRDIAVASFVNEASNQIPNLFMSRFLGQTVVGHYGYAQRTIRTPLGVVSNAFSDVYKSKAAEQINETGHCRPIFTSTAKNLFLLSIIPFSLLYLFAPQLFAFVFGEAFRTSGLYCKILTVPFFLGFISIPLSSTFYLIGKTAVFLLLQTVKLILVILSILIGYAVFKEPETIIILLSGALTLANALILFVLYLFVYRNNR